MNDLLRLLVQLTTGASRMLYGYGLAWYTPRVNSSGTRDGTPYGNQQENQATCCSLTTTI